MDPEGNLLIADGFTALYDRHARALYRYCARRIGPDLAEDAVAQTFLIAFERRHVIERGTADPLPWLYGIATNVLLRHRRDEVRGYRALARTGADPLLVPPAADSHEARTDDRVVARQRARLIARVLARLPARQRDVLLLFAIAELSYAEIAAALDLPTGTVQSALHRARTKLRKALEDLER
ncbi:RNA polymerase sigma factor [Dactylosporangium sp. AC04546]|uniref:RNA polymerase sigma factor n=1 Tax=Dactylosporangium sp. AC04546 TaxID=2862460 RepID=UPI001EDD7248|nr:RNA polymerase sigma factor [Dactylosporangium sp. AC04546]WVK83007.1 RNA polymerase sigma factor [Dactylosporangium sp. AC04546]